MTTLTQEEMEALKVGEIVEVNLSKEDGFTRSGWVPAVVVPSTYYGVVMFFTIPRTTPRKGDTYGDSYDMHRAWVGRMRPDLVRRTTKTFKWSYGAKD